jgi:hypothetical protein
MDLGRTFPFTAQLEDPSDRFYAQKLVHVLVPPGCRCFFFGERRDEAVCRRSGNGRDERAEGLEGDGVSVLNAWL